MLIARGKAVAGLPVADPLGRDVDQRLVGREGWPRRRQRPGALGQDADEDVFGWEGAASVVALPAQVLYDDTHAQWRLQGASHPSCYRSPGGKARAVGGCASNSALIPFSLSMRRAALCATGSILLARVATNLCEAMAVDTAYRCLGLRLFPPFAPRNSTVSSMRLTTSKSV